MISRSLVAAKKCSLYYGFVSEHGRKWQVFYFSTSGSSITLRKLYVLYSYIFYANIIIYSYGKICEYNTYTHVCIRNFAAGPSGQFTRVWLKQRGIIYVYVVVRTTQTRIIYADSEPRAPNRLLFVRTTILLLYTKRLKPDILRTRIKHLAATIPVYTVTENIYALLNQ